MQDDDDEFDDEDEEGSQGGDSVGLGGLGGSASVFSGLNGIGNSAAAAGAKRMARFKMALEKGEKKVIYSYVWPKNGRTGRGIEMREHTRK